MNFNKKKYQKQYSKAYQQTGKRKLYIKKYNHSEMGKASRKKYALTEKGKKAHHEAAIKYNKTEKGKTLNAKKHTKRRCNLEFNVLFENPFAESELIDWHHITDAYVVAIPKDLHQLYYGKYHRENIMTIIKQIYSGVEYYNEKR